MYKRRLKQRRQQESIFFDVYPCSSHLQSSYPTPSASQPPTSWPYPTPTGCSDMLEWSWESSTSMLPREMISYNQEPASQHVQYIAHQHQHLQQSAVHAEFSRPTSLSEVTPGWQTTQPQLSRCFSPDAPAFHISHYQLLSSPITSDSDFGSSTTDDSFTSDCKPCSYTSHQETASSLAFGRRTNAHYPNDDSTCTL